MKRFTSSEALLAACRDLPAGSDEAAAAALARQDTLTKPQGSLGRLEALAAWLARWQGRALPRLDKVEIIVFAGSHGITARGVSAFPAEVTAQMVANFAAGGAAINQLARSAGAGLTVVPLEIERPTADFTIAPAMAEAEFLAAVATGFEAVAGGCRPALPRRNGHRQHHGGRGARRGAVRRLRQRLGRPRHRRRRCRAGAQGGGGRRRARPPRPGAGRSAGGARRGRRPRAGGDLRRDACRAPARHPAAARRLRLHRRGGAACPAARRRARRMRWPPMSPPRRDIAGCCKGWCSSRCSISACGSAKARAPASRSTSCARRSRVTTAWRASPRPAFRKTDVLFLAARQAPRGRIRPAFGAIWPVVCDFRNVIDAILRRRAGMTRKRHVR